MMKYLNTLASILVTISLLAITPAVRAQVTNNTRAEKKAATSEKKAASSEKSAKAAKSEKKEAEKKKAGHPFHGKLAAIDKQQKTIKVGETEYKITSATKITKEGKPATLNDGVVGEECAGYVRPQEDGSFYVSTLRFGARPDEATAEKKAVGKKEKSK